MLSAMAKISKLLINAKDYYFFLSSVNVFHCLLNIKRQVNQCLSRLRQRNFRVLPLCPNSVRFSLILEKKMYLNHVSTDLYPDCLRMFKKY